MSDLPGGFKRQKDFLICIDSDGCAMDTMDCKHIYCFGPCLIPVWHLEPWREQILARWNNINLYTLTRGVNRFKGLAMILTEVNETMRPIPGIQEFVQWVNTAEELSGASVKAKLEADGLDIFRQACQWSEEVNRQIKLLPSEEKKVFLGVREALEAARQFADIAIVSSANRQAVLEEWESHDLLDMVDVVTSQDTGTKSDCIHMLLSLGYPGNHVLMVGDAPGDCQAAADNQVLFYPILVKNEPQSWKQFVQESVGKFWQEKYEGQYQHQLIEQFRQNLGA